MNTTPTDAVILKTDTLGRVKTPVSMKNQAVTSDSSVRAFRFSEVRALLRCNFLITPTKRVRLDFVKKASSKTQIAFSKPS